MAVFRAVVDGQTAVLDAIDRKRRAMRKGVRKGVKRFCTIVDRGYSSNLAAHRGKQPALRRTKDGKYVQRPRLFQQTGIKVGNFTSGKGFYGIMGPLQKPGARHAHLVEKGVKVRFRKKIGGKYFIVEMQIQDGLKSPTKRRTRLHRGSHDLQRAFDSKQDEALNAHKQEIKKAMKHD